MINQSGAVGTQNITTSDIAVGPSGKAVRIYSVHLVSGATASTLTLRNGTSASDTAFIQVDGVISKGVTVDFANGIRFPNGCFADVDANITYATFAVATEI